jgi:farnesyl diphosphate synthase
MVDILAQASGSRGMCGGQAIDIAAEGKQLSLAELENMHIHKTGALLRASVKLGALCHGDLNEQQLQQLDHYGKCIGLAFQIQDDILDITASTEELGKQQGADAARNKPTYPALLGLEGARERARDLYQQSLESLETFGDSAQPLRDLAQFIVQRGN